MITLHVKVVCCWTVIKARRNAFILPDHTVIVFRKPPLIFFSPRESDTTKVLPYLFHTISCHNFMPHLCLSRTSKNTGIWQHHFIHIIHIIKVATQNKVRFYNERKMQLSICLLKVPHMEIWERCSYGKLKPPCWYNFCL